MYRLFQYQKENFQYASEFAAMQRAFQTWQQKDQGGWKRNIKIDFNSESSQFLLDSWN